MVEEGVPMTTLGKKKRSLALTLGIAATLKVWLIPQLHKDSSGDREGSSMEGVWNST
jgi:hypothetical protein